VMRQTFIRGLVKRLANLECSTIKTRYEEWVRGIWIIQTLIE
jgi:hypothetical protein